MTTAQTIIDRAFRQDNIVAAGVTPTSVERTEALAVLASFLEALVGFEMGELVHDWQVPPAATAPYGEVNPRDPYGDDAPSAAYLQPPINSRLLAQITSATTVYLPQYPNDGSRIAVVNVGSTNNSLTLNANGRRIESAASVLVTLNTDTPREWFYRADLGDWKRMHDFSALALDDDMVFPTKYDHMLVCGLSVWLSPRYGIGPSDATLAQYNQLLGKFRAQYKQLTPTAYSDNLAEAQSYRVDGVLGDGFFHG